jgi:flagellar hook-length control protein FliK
MTATAIPENTPKEGAPQGKKTAKGQDSGFGELLSGELVKAKDGRKKSALPLLKEVKGLLQTKQRGPQLLGQLKSPIKSVHLLGKKAEAREPKLNLKEHLNKAQEGALPQAPLLPNAEALQELQPQDGARLSKKDSLSKDSLEAKSALPAGDFRLEPKSKGSNHSVKIEVQDLRKDLAQGTKKNPLKSKTDQRLQGSKTFSLQHSQTPSQTQSQENTIEVQVSKPIELPNGEIRQVPVTEGREALNQLTQQIRTTTGPEIVRMAKFILKDQDMGEIKLRLKPEALGEVKISLNINNGRLGGNILVENNAVRDIFQNSLDNLVRGLREEGFETTGLDVNVRGEEQYSQQGQNQHREHQGRSALWYDNNQLQLPEEDNSLGSMRAWYGYNTVDFKA